MLKREVVKTLWGFFEITHKNNEILELKPLMDGVEESKSLTDFSKLVKDELNLYFKGRKRKIDLRMSNEIVLTPFQKRVYKVVEKIPYGKTRTYKDIAKELGNENLARAVGQALKRNKIPLLIPCHRVIGKNSLGGYGGKNLLFLKEKLLKLEGAL